MRGPTRRGRYVILWPVLSAIDHVIVGVRDLDRATRSYARLFGRTPSWRGEQPSRGTASTLFRLSNTCLELLSPVGEGPLANPLARRLESRGEGPVGLALRTASAGSLRQSWIRSGLHPNDLRHGLDRDVESGAFREWTEVHLPPEDTAGLLLFGIEPRSPDEVLPVARPLEDEKTAVAGLDHAVVRSRNPERVIGFCRDRLGLRLALDREFPQWGSRLLFFRLGGATLEVAAPCGEPADPEAQDELWGLSWRTQDARGCRERMVASGIEASEVRAGRKPGTFVFTVKAPTHGVPTLVKQPAPRDDAA